MKIQQMVKILTKDLKEHTYNTETRNFEMKAYYEGRIDSLREIAKMMDFDWNTIEQAAEDIIEGKKNVYLFGKIYGKEEINPAVIQFLKERGDEVHNEEIHDFVFDKFGYHFMNFSDVMKGIRNGDSRIIKGIEKGYSKFVDIERLSGDEEGFELLIKDEGNFEKLQGK